MRQGLNNCYHQISVECASFIKTADHRPTNHRSHNHRPTDPIITDPPTELYLKDLTIEKLMFYGTQTKLAK